MIRSVADSTVEACCVGGRSTVTPSSPTRTHTSATTPIDDAATYRFKSSTVAPQVQRPHCGHSSGSTLRANPPDRLICRQGSDTSHAMSQGSKPPPPALGVPVASRVHALGQAERRLLGPRNNMCCAPRNGPQACRARVFLGCTGKAANLVVPTIGPTLRARHGGEAVHLEGTCLAPRSLLATFTSHATTVPRRNTRRTFSWASTSTMSAFLPGASEPTVSSPRMVAPCTDAM